ncbi:hypothetical protein PSHT_09440 [Puccinia striiformis]|uniref:Uncharacterized protein n=1 Tax=Puccinia striiformis TaxID=27350 RepID=A0A2S4VGQ2_9BASI|nr:hypothetical protein PSHT_09440 [Puccinia striiformis]
MLSSYQRQLFVMFFASHVLLLAFTPSFTLGLPLGSTIKSFLNDWLGISDTSSLGDLANLSPCIPKGMKNSTPTSTAWGSRHTNGNTEALRLRLEQEVSWIVEIWKAWTLRKSSNIVGTGDLSGLTSSSINSSLSGGANLTDSGSSALGDLDSSLSDSSAGAIAGASADSYDLSGGGLSGSDDRPSGDGKLGGDPLGGDLSGSGAGSGGGLSGSGSGSGGGLSGSGSALEEDYQDPALALEEDYQDPALALEEDYPVPAQALEADRPSGKGSSGGESSGAPGGDSKLLGGSDNPPAEEEENCDEGEQK